MSVCNKNFNSKISVQSGYLEFSLVAASTEIPKWAPILPIEDNIFFHFLKASTKTSTYVGSC